MILPRAARTMDDLPSEHAVAVIDSQLIERLVLTFYGRVREDALLGPIFNAVVSDWDHHLRTLTAFWSSVMLGSSEYAGSPMQKHAPLPITAQHFAHWLALFADTARAVCAEEAALLFIARAQRIAESLQWGLLNRSTRDNRHPQATGEPPADCPVRR